MAMVDARDTKRGAVLSPPERISEVLFGLIMVLTFTGSLSAATAQREEIRAMLIAALGCNLVWGLIDAAFYLMARLAERRRNLQLLEALGGSVGEAETRELIGDVLPPVIAALMRPSEYAFLREELLKLPPALKRPLVTLRDLRAAVGIFLLVFLSTFPVVLPFLFMQDATAALRVSNAIAVLMLFAAGASLARYSGHRPLLMGLGTMLIGLALVSLTMALGG